MLVKYSPTGSLLWQKIWSNGSSISSVGGIAVDSSGSVYVVGQLIMSPCTPGYWTGFAVKFDSDGNVQWQESFKGHVDLSPSGIALDSSKNVYISAITYGYGAGGTDMVIFKLNSSGVLQWEKTWGGSGSDGALGIAADPSGNVYVVGSTASFGGGGGVLLKIDTSGSTLLFQKILSQVTAYTVALDSLGNIYLGSSIYTQANQNALLMKFDATSGFQWAKTWGGSNGTENVNALAVDPSGNPAIVGYTDSYGQGGTCFGHFTGNTCYDLFYAKLNSTGGLLTQFVYGGARGDDEANAIAFSSSGNAAIAGSVAEAGPYQLGSGNNTLGTTSFTISTFGNSTLGTAASTTQPLSGSTATPSGSESYAGGTDALLLEYGTMPSTTTSAPLSPATILIATLLTIPLLIRQRRRRN